MLIQTKISNILITTFNIRKEFDDNLVPCSWNPSGISLIYLDLKIFRLGGELDSSVSEVISILNEAWY